MANADIGLIGLGVMGSNLALNIAEKGYRVAVFNRTAEQTRAFHAEAGELQGMIVPCETMAELAAAIKPPRPVILLVPAGKPVDEQIALLRRVLSAGDIIIDAIPVIDYPGGGNAIEFLTTIDRMLTLDFDTAILGHGRTMTKQEVRDYRMRCEEFPRANRSRFAARLRTSR